VGGPLAQEVGDGLLGSLVLQVVQDVDETAGQRAQ
jgi:hypothetical protein